MYTLPKIHKEPATWYNPFKIPQGRPIVSDVGSESYPISEYVDSFLAPLATKHQAYLRDTNDFLDKIRHIKIPQNNLLVTLDVESMYTNIDNKDGLQAVLNCFRSNPDPKRSDLEILEMLKLGLVNNDFEFNGKWYLQISGTAMGKKFAPSYANIFMAEWEKEVFKRCNYLPLVYFRFLDDIFLIWPFSRKKFDTFLSILNSYHPSVKLKACLMDTSVDFLDTTIFKGPQFEHTGKLDSKVYFKPTDTHQLLHKSSFHPRHTFTGILKSQIIRFHRLCTRNEDFQKASTTLFRTLRERGYSKRFQRKIKSTTLSELRVDVHTLGKATSCQGRRCATCPFVRESNNFTSHTNNQTFLIKQNLSCNSSNIIYLITCNLCSKQYVGQTTLTLRDRFTRHRFDIIHKANKSISNHFNSEGHTLEDCSILPIEMVVNKENLTKREAYWIKKLGTITPFGLTLHEEVIDIISFVITYNTKAALAAKLIREGFVKIQKDFPRIYHQKFITAYRKNKNLCDILIRNKIRRSFEIPQDHAHDASAGKANEIVNEISSLKKQIKGLVSDAEQLKNYTRETSPISVKAASYIPKDIHYGPSPLDPYLELPESGVENPYKSIPDLEPIRFNAPLLPGFKDAEGVLRQVQKSRGYLEANLETVMKARQETEVFSLLQAVYHDSSDQERVRIKHLVDEKVAKMRKEIEREVTDERVWEEINKKKNLQVLGAAKPMPAPVSVKPYSRGTQRQGTATAAKADSELRKQTGRQSAAVINRRPAGKENISQRPKPQVRPKQRSPFEDEEYMTHVYGKALYQKGRTTVKAPYIHLQNDPKQKPSRPPGVQEVRGVEVKSSKVQTAPVVKQYYFNPTDGTYIPVSVASGAPIQGQLIPMAVPLGEPRLDPGLKMPTSTSIPSGPMSSAHRVMPPTAARNVTLVSLPTELPKKEQHIPELGKQVLPAVDIDTDISDILEVTESHLQSAMSAERTRSPPKLPKKTRSRSQSPPKVKTLKMVHVESPAQSPTKAELNDTVPVENDQEQEEDDEEESYVEEEDADVESATGIELPGYQAPELPPQEHHNLEFPLRPSSGDRQMTSDLIAEDIRRRDALQNKAVEWIEQELMAQIITELFPLRQHEEPPEISHVVSEESEESMAEDKEEAMFIMDSIGRGGLQLFVDAGMPVSNELVQDLVREVITEKIRTMLGHKPDEESELKAATRLVTTTNQTDMRETQPESWDQHLSRQVRTPEPTPKQSPTSSPPRRMSPPVTPEASPRFVTDKPEPVFVMPEPIPAPAQAPEIKESESEPESSVSFDIKEELQRLAGELIVQDETSVMQIYDVATPPASPKPEPPPVEEFQLPTPPMLSPRLPKKEPLDLPETAKLEEKKPESPQPWSNPESPRPEENPEFTERDQPKPMEFRAFPRVEMPVIQQTEAEKPLPSPAEPRPKVRPSSPPTESESITESTQSDTINEIISEGQWFLDKSEGEVAEFQIDEIARQRMMAQTTRRKVDASTVSTLKDTEDLDLLEESAELDKSDGEYIYRTPVAPEDDPILNLLAKLQHQSQYQPVVYGQYEMSPSHVQQLLKASGKSVGEVTLHGTVRSEGEIFGGDPVKSRELIRYPERRFPEPQKRRQSPTRVSFDAKRQFAEYERPLRDSTILDGDMPEEDIEIPESDTGRKTPTGRVTPGGRQLQGRSITVSAGGRASPVKSALKRPPMITQSGSIPEMRGSRLVQVRSSSEDLRESQENYSGYEGIKYGSRSMTPDQMNLDSLIQSGYLSQSFSQSENGKLGQSGLSGGAASLRSSTEFHQPSPNRLTGRKNSLGLTYSMETDGSGNEEEMHHLAGSGTGTLKMKVTIPYTSDQEDESDVSEIDITDGNTR